MITHTGAKEGVTSRKLAVAGAGNPRSIEASVVVLVLLRVLVPVYLASFVCLQTGIVGVYTEFGLVRIDS